MLLIECKGIFFDIRKYLSKITDIRKIIAPMQCPSSTPATLFRVLYDASHIRSIFRAADNFPLYRDNLCCYVDRAWLFYLYCINKLADDAERVGIFGIDAYRFIGAIERLERDGFMLPFIILIKNFLAMIDLD